MIGSFILVALQVLAVTPNSYGVTMTRHYGWVQLGTFASENDCRAASSRLISSDPQQKATVIQFQCLPVGASR